jgi:hypothetical protein
MFEMSVIPFLNDRKRHRARKWQFDTYIPKGFLIIDHEVACGLLSIEGCNLPGHFTTLRVCSASESQDGGKESRISEGWAGPTCASVSLRGRCPMRASAAGRPASSMFRNLRHFEWRDSSRWASPDSRDRASGALTRVERSILLRAGVSARIDRHFSGPK